MVHWSIIFVAIIGTFILTAIWQYFAERQKNKVYAVFFKAVLHDMNKMSKKMGYEDIADYLLKEEGEEYASKAITNIKSTFEALLREDEIIELGIDY